MYVLPQKIYIHLLSFLKFTIVVLCVQVSLSNPCLAEDVTYSDWTTVADDLESMQISQTGALGTTLQLIRTSLRKLRVGVIRAAEFGWQRSTANALCKASKAVACINANFFDPDGEALGLVVSKGVLQHAVHQGGNTLTGIFQVSRNSMSIINRSNFEMGNTIDAVQAGPRLLINKSSVQGIRGSGRARRSGLCIDQEKRLILFAGGIGPRGWSVDELQTILVDPHIGCVDALNLDGGGSAQLYVSPNAPGSSADAGIIEVEGYDSVPVVLGLLVR